HGSLPIDGRRPDVCRGRSSARRSVEDQRLPTPWWPGRGRRAGSPLRDLVHGGHGGSPGRSLCGRRRRSALRLAATRAHGNRVGARPRSTRRGCHGPWRRRVGGFDRGPSPDLVTLYRRGRANARLRPGAVAGDQGLDAGRRRGARRVHRGLARGAVPGHQDDRALREQQGGRWAMTNVRWAPVIVTVAMLGGGALAQAQHQHGAPAAKPAETSEPKRVTMEELHRGGGVPPGWRFAWPAGDPARGREVFAKLECYQCHEVKGEKFPAVTPDPTRRGPELSGMGAHHPAEYFAESIINPNAVILLGPGHTGPDGLSIIA